jgi:hypothetical protein
MRKLLFVMIAIGGVGWYIRGNPTGPVPGAGGSLLTMGLGQAQMAFTSLAGLLMQHGLGPQAASAPGTAGAPGTVGAAGTVGTPGTVAAPAPRTMPAMPNVTSLSGTYVGSTNAGSTNGGAAAAGGFVVPPELTRFVNPSLLTSNPTGTQNLSPESQAALQQIIARVRANPSAFKEQLSAVAKQVGASR